MTDKPVAVLGAGSWGTALAMLLSRNGRPALLWAHNPEHIEQMRAAGSNERYLPGLRFPAKLTLTDNLPHTVRDAGDVLIAVPSHAFRQVLEALAPHLGPASRIAWATKGLEHGTCRLLHELVDEILGSGVPSAMISGPTFAREVAAGLPTAVTVASRSEAFAADLAERLHDEYFRAYTCQDVIGVEVGGAVKNVLAIAAGITDGLKFGANSRAALITRGLVELARLGLSLGGKRETFMGLAGLGDLVLTCTDDQSRNRRLGLAIAQGRRRDDAVRDIGQVVEGIQTAREVHELAQRQAVEMPICEEVYRILHQGHNPQRAVHELLSRVQKPETF